MKLIIACVLSMAAIVLALQLAAPIRQRWEMDNVHAARLAEIEAQRAQFELQQEMIHQQATAPARIIWSYALLILVGAGAVGAIWLISDMYRQRRSPLVRYAAGMYVPRGLIEQADPRLLALMAEAVRLEGAAAIARAEHQPGQQPASYSPHITVARGAPAAEAEADQRLALPVNEHGELPAVVDLATVLQDFTPTQEAILLGLDPHGERITAPMRSMMHCALLGATGTGKSNLLRFLLPQLQAAGARVVLSDPHYSDVDPDTGEDWTPIRQRLYHQPAVKPAEIKALFEWLIEELDQRLERRRRQESIGVPIFWAFDELPILVNLVQDAPEHMGRIVREGRKVSLFAIGASQEWLVKVIGGSSGARDSFRTAYYLGGDRTSAAALLDMPARTIEDAGLGHGTALLRAVGVNQARRVRVPLASNEGIYRLLGAGASATWRHTPETNYTVIEAEPVADRMPESSQNVAAGYAASSAPVSLEARRAAEKFLSGMHPAQIVAEMRGIKSNQGAKYQAALTEVLDLIRAGIDRGAA